MTKSTLRLLKLAKCLLLIIAFALPSKTVVGQTFNLSCADVLLTELRAKKSGR